MLLPLSFRSPTNRPPVRWQKSPRPPRPLKNPPSQHPRPPPRGFPSDPPGPRGTPRLARSPPKPPAARGGRTAWPPRPCPAAICPGASSHRSRQSSPHCAPPRPVGSTTPPIPSLSAPTNRTARFGSGRRSDGFPDAAVPRAIRAAGGRRPAFWPPRSIPPRPRGPCRRKPPRHHRSSCATPGKHDAPRPRANTPSPNPQPREKNVP